MLMMMMSKSGPRFEEKNRYQEKEIWVGLTINILNVFGKTTTHRDGKNVEKDQNRMKK